MLGERELVSTQNFRQRMEKRVVADEASLRGAIAETEQEMRKLRAYLAGLAPDQYQLLGSQAQSEMKALGELMQKWESQISHLKSQEAEARTSRWQEDKSKEETRRYVANVEAGVAEGKMRLEAVRMLHDALGELENAFSFCQMIVTKAEVQQFPGAISLGKVDSVILKFEAILAGIRDRLPEAEVRDATRKLDRIKAYRAEMSGVLERLGYHKEVAGYEARQESEGIRYFRSNLPSGVREILPAKDIEKLEEVASTGVNGAKEAISIALRMAGKKSPEKVRAFLGR